QKHDFSLKLTRVIQPKGGPGVELATLENAARFMGKSGRFGSGGRIGIMLRSWCVGNITFRMTSSRRSGWRRNPGGSVGRRAVPWGCLKNLKRDLFVTN